MYIFGYGSLVNINSAQKSFKRELKDKDFIPVVLNGYKKSWNSIEYIVFEDEDKISNGVFLNLTKCENSKTVGVLLEITKQEFEFLKLREKNYSCIELFSKNIDGFNSDQKIYTFVTTNKRKIANIGQKDCVIPKKYIDLLENGLSIYSEDFRKKFINSYSNFPFKIKEGRYSFSDPIQNKYAKDGFKNEG